MRHQYDSFSAEIPVRPQVPAQRANPASKATVSEAPAATPDNNLSPADSAIFGPPIDYVGSPGTVPFLSFSGSVTSNTDLDFYYVPLEEGVAYEIIVVGTGPAFNQPPSLSVSGIGVTGGAGYENALGNYFTGIIGTHLPLSITVSNSFTGDYVIYVNRLLDEVPADTTTSAIITPGSTSFGRLDSPVDQDWFRAELLADRTYLVTAAANLPFDGSVHGVSGNFRISVYSETGEFVGTLDDGWQFGTSFQFETSVSGTFYFAVDAPGIAGNYFLRLDDDQANSRSTAQTIQIGASVSADFIQGHGTGAAPSEFESDYYAVNLTAGTTYDFSLYTFEVPAGTLTIEDANGNILASSLSPDGSFLSESLIQFTPSASGTYFLHAYGRGVGYELHTAIITPSVDAAPATAGTGPILQLDTPQVALIDYRGDTDFYRVMLEAGRSYEFSAGVANGLDPVDRIGVGLFLSGQVLAGDTTDYINGGSNTATFSFVAPTTGMYDLRVMSLRNGGTGGYQVTVVEEPSGSTATRATLAVGASTIGYINFESDSDWYRVTLQQGQTIGVATELPFPLALTGMNLQVRDASGAVVSSDAYVYSIVANGLEFTAATSGTYYVSVGFGSNARVGLEYELSIDARNPAIDIHLAGTGTNASLATGQTVNASIDHLADRDTFAVQVVAGQYYTVSIDGGLNFLRDGLHATINGLTARALDGAPGFVSFLATQSGTLYLDVFSANPVHTGNYSLSLTSTSVVPPADNIGNTPATALAIAPDQTITSTISEYEDVDVFRVSLVAGQPYRVNVGGDNGIVIFDAIARVEISRADGGNLNSLSIGNFGNWADQVFIPSVSGDYFFSVRSGNQASPYTFEVTTLTDVSQLLDNNVMFESSVREDSTLRVYFSVFGEPAPFNDSIALDWTPEQRAAVQAVFDHISSIIDFTFEIVTDRGEADWTFMMTSGEHPMTAPGTSIFTPDSAFFQPAGADWAAATRSVVGGVAGMIGLEHATFTPAEWVTLDFDWRVYGQGISTITGAQGWWEAYHFLGTLDAPGDATALMALDIARLQSIYGPNTNTNNTATVYEISATGVGFRSIWDTGGTDTLRAAPGTTASVTIDLRAATLAFDLTGAGYLSFVHGNPSGFTIAHGVVIENAIGGSGEDTLTGNSANNQLTGGAGADLFVFVGANGNDTITDFNTSVDQIDLRAYSEAEVQAAISSLRTVGGNAVFDLPSGTVTLTGVSHTSLSNSHFLSSSNPLPSYVRTGTSGNDFLHGTAGNDTMTGGAGDDTLSGYAGNDLLQGGDGADLLVGAEGHDTLLGGAGDDRLEGGTGDDVLTGGAGRDRFYFANLNGTDTITDFNPSEDIIDLRALLLGPLPDVLASAYTVNGNAVIVLPNGTITLMGVAHTALSASNVLTEAGGIMTGTPGADVLWGSVRNDTVQGLAGADELYGNAGADTLLGGDGDDWLEGGAGDDFLSGGSGSDYLVGGTGNDTMSGGSGIDIFEVGTTRGTDTITDFAPGIDILYLNAWDFAGLREFMNRVSYANGNAYIAFPEGTLILTGIQPNALLTTDFFPQPSSFRNGTSARDIMIGTLGVDVLGGGGGDDFLAGLSGNDEIYGDGGVDILHGGTGNDVIFGGDGNDWLHGGPGNDSLAGENGADIYFFMEGAGHDTINNFGVFEDFIDLRGLTPSQQAAAVASMIFYQGSTLILLPGGSITVYGVSPVSLTSRFLLSPDSRQAGTAGRDVLNGTAASDALEGFSGDDTLYGNDGDDDLYGGDGNDALHGGAGINRMFGGNGNDFFYANPSDLVFGGAGYDSLVIQSPSTSGPLVLSLFESGLERVYASHFADYLDGSGVAVGIVLYGFGGADVLLGGSGADFLYVDYEDIQSGVVRGGAGYDYIVHQSPASFTGTVTFNMNILEVEGFFGSARAEIINAAGLSTFATIYTGGGADVVTGSIFNDRIFTDNAASIDAGAGFDYIVYNVLNGSGANFNLAAMNAEGAIGRDGNDVLDASGVTTSFVTLYGYGGADTLLGGTGNDYIYMDAADLAGGSVQAGAGYDYLINQGGTALSIVLTDHGAEGFFGSAAAETISAAGLTTFATIFSGGGADTIIGSAYNDTLYIDNQTASVNAGAGYDYLVYRLLDGTGAAGWNLASMGAEGAIGRDGNDTFDASGVNTFATLYGYGGNDTLTGGAFNDAFYGGTGNDTMTGNGGSDSFVFENGWGSDTITDFTVGADRMLMRVSGLTQFNQLSVIQSAADTLVSFGGQQIRLLNVTAATITAASFQFLASAETADPDAPLAEAPGTFDFSNLAEAPGKDSPPVMEPPTAPRWRETHDGPLADHLFVDYGPGDTFDFALRHTDAHHWDMA